VVLELSVADDATDAVGVRLPVADDVDRIQLYSLLGSSPGGDCCR
jgi:hypothetical protein